MQKKKKKAECSFWPVIGYFLFSQTVHILTWLNCYLGFITSATPNHTLSCQIHCFYPRVVGNVILFQSQHVVCFHLEWLSSAWSPGLYYMVWFLVHHSVSCYCRMYCTIPTRVVKLEFNSLKELQSLAPSVIPFFKQNSTQPSWPCLGFLLFFQNCSETFHQTEST